MTKSYKKAFQLSNREVQWIRSTVPEKRAFLIKHGRDSVIATLNLSSMPDLIKVLSGRKETVEELQRLMDRVGTDPKDWLPTFMGRGGPMRYRFVLATLSLLPLSVPRARADVPTIDAAQLDQHTNIANTKVKLIPIVTNHATADQGIHCAATRGKRGPSPIRRRRPMPRLAPAQSSRRRLPRSQRSRRPRRDQCWRCRTRGARRRQSPPA